MLCISRYITALVLVCSAHNLHSQANVVGQWGSTQSFPFVSVHTCLMPDGRVIFWDYSGNTRIWDPATTAITTPAQPGRNTFCSGNSFLPDGKLFVPGGHIENNVGLASASFYDPAANTWTSVPNMNAGRWYPSSTVLPNGDILATSGDANHQVNDLPQVFQFANNTWRNLTSARLGLPLYPRTFLAPNGRVFFATSTSATLIPLAPAHGRPSATPSFRGATTTALRLSITLRKCTGSVVAIRPRRLLR